MKLTTAIEGFFLEKRLRFSKRTVEGYHYHLDYFIGFMGNVEFEAIQSDDVRRFLEWMHVKKGLSKRTVHDAWVVLSSLWTWAENELGTAHIIRRKIGRPEYTQRAIERVGPNNWQRNWFGDVFRTLTTEIGNAAGDGMRQWDEARGEAWLNPVARDDQSVTAVRVQQ